MGQVLENQKSFSAVNADILIDNLSVVSASNFSLTVKQEKPNNYGFSTEPVSFGEGIKEYECSIDLAKKDIQKLRNQSPTRSLTDMSLFSVLVVLNNGVNLARIRVNNCRFTEDGIEFATGDSEIKKTYSLMVAGVDFL